jgi:hypothetical protein
MKAITHRRVQPTLPLTLAQPLARTNLLFITLAAAFCVSRRRAKIEKNSATN